MEDVPVVTTLPPGPNVVWTGVLQPEDSPGDGAVDPPPPRPGLVNVEDPGLDEVCPDPVPGPVEEPGLPGLGRNAMGRITTFP